jgi:hypothetical protein
MVGRVARLLLVLVPAVVCSAQLHAATLLEKNFWLFGPRYHRVLPPCEHQAALERIATNFHTKEDRFWNSDLRIVGFEDIRETAFMPWAAQSIPRRFCRGYVLINDGLRHAIFYSIAEDTAMIGMSWGVNFCVVGLDRNMAYSPGCRMARP